MDGGKDKDKIVAGNGNDVLKGSNGDDRLDGGAGVDALYGGNGNDILIGGAAADLLDGGKGRDAVYYTNANTGVTVNLGDASKNTGDAAGDSFTSIEILMGSRFDDRLFGDATNNEVNGGAGADTLFGGRGDDAMQGGAGVDLLTGGAGADLFQFSLASDTGSTTGTADRVADFSQAEGDLIDLRLLDADQGQIGLQHFNFIGADGFSGVAGELRYTRGPGITKIEADTDGLGGADLVIVLSGRIALDLGDFLLV